MNVPTSGAGEEEQCLWMVKVRSTVSTSWPGRGRVRFRVVAMFRSGRRQREGQPLRHSGESCRKGFECSPASHASSSVLKESGEFHRSFLCLRSASPQGCYSGDELPRHRVSLRGLPHQFLQPDPRPRSYKSVSCHGSFNCSVAEYQRQRGWCAIPTASW